MSGLKFPGYYKRADRVSRSDFEAQEYYDSRTRRRITDAELARAVAIAIHPDSAPDKMRLLLNLIAAL